MEFVRDKVLENGGGPRCGECQMPIPNTLGSLCVSTESPADSKIPSDTSACATPDCSSLTSAASTRSGSFRKQQLDGLVEFNREQNQGSFFHSTSDDSLDGCSSLFAGNAEDVDDSSGPALSSGIAGRLSMGGTTGIGREETTCSGKTLQNHGSSSTFPGALKKSASSSNIENMIVRRGMASPARALAAGLGLARSSSFHCKPPRRRSSLNTGKAVMFSSIPLSSQEQTLTISLGQFCSNREGTSSPMFAIKPGHARVLTSSGSRRGSEFGSSQGSLFSLLEDGDELPSPAGNVWVQEITDASPLKWKTRCQQRRGQARIHTPLESSVHAPVESPVGNDNEVVEPGHALNDRFYQSSFDDLEEGNSEESVNEEIGVDQIVSLACPRLNHVRRESVRSTFHGRRGSVVALDVLHRDRQGADSKNKEEISSMCVSDLLDRLDLPKEDEERNGKGMVPSASYSQLHGQLGFGKTITDPAQISPDDGYVNWVGRMSPMFARSKYGKGSPLSPRREYVQGKEPSALSHPESSPLMSLVSPKTGDVLSPLGSPFGPSPFGEGNVPSMAQLRSGNSSNASPRRGPGPGSPFSPLSKISSPMAVRPLRSGRSSNAAKKITPQSRQLQWKSMSDIKLQFQNKGIPPVERHTRDQSNKPSTSTFYFAQRRSAGLQLLPWPERDEEEFQRGKAMLGTLQIDPMSFHPDTLMHLALEIFVELDLPSQLSVPMERVQKFIIAVKGRMEPNPYHGWHHVFDVTQTVLVFARHSGLLDRMSAMEKFGLIVAALCHDLEHPGVNNLELIEKRPVYKEMRGGVSLEKHHSLRAFEVMVDTDIDLLSGFNTSTYYSFRDMVMNVILSTDMTRHGEFFERAKNEGGGISRRLDGEGEGEGKGTNMRREDLLFGMQLLIKAADISNPIKPFPVAAKWAVRVTDEFFQQGDMELEAGLDVTPTCDRTRQTRVGLQKGFIDFLAVPYFEVVASVFPKIKEDFARVYENRRLWDDMTDEELEARYSYDDNDNLDGAETEQSTEKQPHTN